MGVFKIEITQFSEITDRTIRDSLEEAQEFVLDFASRAQDPDFTSVITDETTAATMVAVRFQRAQELSATDWTQMPDSPLTDETKEAFKKYRQALRDLPENITDINDIVWPTAPMDY